MFINKNTYVGDTGKQLKDIANIGNTISKDGWKLTKIGTYDDNKPIYLAYATLGTLPNASIKDFNYSLPNFYGILQVQLLAYDNDGNRIPLPYINIYPSQYAQYWIGIELISNNIIKINTGMDRSNYYLWASFIYVATGEIT